MTPRQQQGTEESPLREPGTAERGAAPPKEALLAGIVESSADAIIGWTLGGTIFSWNVGAEKLLGYFIAEAVGEYIGIIVPPERQVEIESLRHRTEADERLERYETVLVKKATLLGLGPGSTGVSLRAKFRLKSGDDALHHRPTFGADRTRRRNNRKSDSSTHAAGKTRRRY
jgi:PAS domain-containing protein